MLSLPVDAVEACARDGYVILPGFVDGATMQEWADELEAMPETPGRQMVYYEDSVTQRGRRVRARIEDLVPYHAGLADLLTRGPLQQAASLLFGEEAVLFKEKLILRMPGGQAMAAHQDVQAGWLDYGTRFMSAMVAVTEGTAANGCLEIVAGAHRDGLLAPCWAPLPDSLTRQMRFLPVLCEPGDVVFFDGLTPHRSGENRTGRPRRAFYATWSLASEGDHRRGYFDDKRRAYPPDCERDGAREYVYRV